MLALLRRSTAVAKPVVSLSAKEVEEFMGLLDKIENERLWNLSLFIAVGDYMLRTGVTYSELIKRYDAVCPDYRKKDFPLKDGLNYAGPWVENFRKVLVSEIYIKVSKGESFDPKNVIEEQAKRYYASMPY